MRILINRTNNSRFQTLSDLTNIHAFKITEADNWNVKVGLANLNETLNLKKAVENLSTASVKIAIGVPGDSSLLFSTLSTYSQPTATITSSGLGYKIDLKEEDYLSGNVILQTVEGVSSSINPKMSISQIQNAIRKGYTSESPQIISEGNGVFEVITSLATPNLISNNYELLDYLTGEFYAAEGSLAAFYALEDKPNLFLQVVLEQGTINETVLYQSVSLPRTIVGNPTPPPAGETYLTETEGDARYLLKSNNLSDLADNAVARTNLGVAENINDLGDVTLTALTNGEAIVYNSTSTKWENQVVSTFSGDYNDLTNQPTIPNSVDDLSDVDTTTSTPTTGQVLKWDGSNFIPQNETNGTFIINDATDVTISTPANGEALVYNSTSTKWENQVVSTFSGDYNDLTNQPTIPTNLNDLGDVTNTIPTNGQILVHDGVDYKNRMLANGDIPPLDSSKIITGVFSNARIPSLDTSKITTGVFANARIPLSGVDKGAVPGASSQAYIQTLEIPNGSTTPAWVEKVSSGGGLTFFDKLTLYAEDYTFIGQYDTDVELNAAIALEGAGAYRVVNGKSFMLKAEFGIDSTRFIIDTHHVTPTVYQSDSAGIPACKVFCGDSATVDHRHINFTGFPEALLTYTGSATQLAVFDFGRVQSEATSHSAGSIIQIGRVKFTDTALGGNTLNNNLIFLGCPTSTANANITLELNSTQEIVNFFDVVRGGAFLSTSKLIVRKGNIIPSPNSVPITRGTFNVGELNVTLFDTVYDLADCDFITKSTNNNITAYNCIVNADNFPAGNYNGGRYSVDAASDNDIICNNISDFVIRTGSQNKGTFNNCNLDFQFDNTTKQQLWGVYKNSTLRATGNVTSVTTYDLILARFYGNNIVFAATGSTNTLDISVSFGAGNMRAGAKVYINKPIGSGSNANIVLDTNINVNDLF